MAALLVSLAVMSVLHERALPAWRHEAQREKEAELVFRGEQYARAVALYRAKNQNAFPPSVDVLVQGKFLRKKYLDPITNKDFDLIGVGTQTPGSTPGTPADPGRGRPSRHRPPGWPRDIGTSPAGGPGATQSPSGFTTCRGCPERLHQSHDRVVSGGIMGVHSKSQETRSASTKVRPATTSGTSCSPRMNRPGGNDPGALNPGRPRRRRASGSQRRARPWRWRRHGPRWPRHGAGRGPGGFGRPSRRSPPRFPPGPGGAGS